MIKLDHILNCEPKEVKMLATSDSSDKRLRYSLQKPRPLSFLLEGKAYCGMNVMILYNENNYRGLEGWASFMLKTLNKFY